MALRPRAGSMARGRQAFINAFFHAGKPALKEFGRSSSRGARSAGLAEICHPKEVAALFSAFGSGGGKHEGIACWQLLFYAMWHAVHVEKRSAADDVLTLLEAK